MIKQAGTTHPIGSIAHFQRRYLNILGILTIDTDVKAPTSVFVSTGDLLILSMIARSELCYLQRRWIKGDTRRNRRMNELQWSLSMIRRALDPLQHGDSYAVGARLAVSGLLDTR